MTITNEQVFHTVRNRYPNAQIYILDEEYDVPTREQVEGYYNAFIRRMGIARLTAWVKNVGDCDKWAWVLKAWVTLHNWLKKDTNAEPIGLICYFVNGDETKGHCINNAIWREGLGFTIQEIEPQPKNGIISLTKAERESAWLVII